MAISRVKTWSSGEVLTASDLNAEYNNILNNASDLVSPFTKAISMGGFALNFDAANTIAMTGTTSGVILTGGTFREPTEDSLTAFATGGQTNATALSAAKKFHRISTCATAADSAKLPTSTAGQWHYVRNDGAASSQIFGTSPDTINGVATGTGVPLPAGTGSWFVCTTAGNWTSTALGALQLSTLTTKGDLLVATASAAVARQGVGSDGQALQADSSQTNGVVYIDNPSRPNLLINPNWQIDQINEGALATVNTTGVNGPDGWSGSAVGAGVFKLRTLADPDNAALKCLEISCTTADASLAATDDYFIYTAVEGYDAAALMAGTSAAQAITVQFKFKTTTTGVYGVSIANSALNRRYIGTITVADTSEHEYSVSLTMDTSGTWLYTNGVGCYLRLCLAAGSNFQSTSGAWAAGAEQTTSSQANFMSVNTNIAYLKRIQLIPGSLVQAYRPADIQKELAKAQRYYAKTFQQGTAPGQAVTSVGSLLVSLGGTAGPAITWFLPVTMRAVPTAVTYSPTAGSAAWRNSTASADIAATLSPDTNGADSKVQIASGSNGSVNDHCYIQASANARLS